MIEVEIRELTRSETASGAAVLGRGMRDNSLHVQVFGSVPSRRQEALTRLFEVVLRQQMARGVILGAFTSGELVGVSAMIPPGHCQPSLAEKLRVLPALLGGSGLRGTLGVVRWVGKWSRRDPHTEHWHLGPVGVELHLQGRGIGTSLLRGFCRRVDENRSPAYLETDKRENVSFYERFGFEVVAECEVLGVPNWFMLRGMENASQPRKLRRSRFSSSAGS